MKKQQTTDLDLARDELFGHIHRCGVLRATPEQQGEWLGETIESLGERYPALSEADLAELRAIGTRFCQPVIDNAASRTAPAAEASSEMAGAA